MAANTVKAEVGTNWLICTYESYFSINHFLYVYGEYIYLYLCLHKMETLVLVRVAENIFFQVMSIKTEKCIYFVPDLLLEHGQSNT